MIVGIIGSRRRNSEKDRSKLSKYLSRIGNIDKIITGDCLKGGDKFAREIAKEFNIELDVKKVEFPPNCSPYYDFVKAYYKRDEEIAKEEMNFLIALVSDDRTGGTEKTIEYFKQYHEDWKYKLILL